MIYTYKLWPGHLPELSKCRRSQDHKCKIRVYQNVLGIDCLFKCIGQWRIKDDNFNKWGKYIANQNKMPYCWEDIADRLHKNINLPF